MNGKKKIWINTEILARFLCHIDGCSDYLFNRYIFVI